MKAKFEVKCEEIGFSRSEEIPLERGYCHELADNLSRAMDFYGLRIENRKLRQDLKDSQKEAAGYEKAAKEWMADYDKLKEKYEPLIPVLSDLGGLVCPNPRDSTFCGCILCGLPTSKNGECFNCFPPRDDR